ncbi:MAG: translation elongation factor Ts [Candidatus Colwellbacteria bacterium]|nr:translation elongation factor Ts [Candidatus Colwellbacteria bacterium]
MATPADIQNLRALTGAGVMDCKKAFEEAGGNIDEAVKILKEKGLDRAAKRADREAGAGIVDAYIHQDKIGVLLELNSETDFVARTNEFKELAHNLSMQVAAMNPESVEALLAENYIRDDSKTVSDLINDVIAKTGENIKVGRFIRYEL